MHTFLTMIIEESVCFMSCEPIYFVQLFLCGTHRIYIFFFSSTEHCAWAIISPKEFNIICITVLENREICCQIFCDLLLKSAFEQIFNVMQLIIVKIKWHIKWKYLIQKFHDICLSYYFNFANGCRSHFLYHGCFMVSIAIFFDWLKPILFYQQVLFWTISDVVNYTELKLILLKFCLFTENTHGKKAQRKISKI